MDQTAPSDDVQRLEAAIRRLEQALAKRSDDGNAELQRRHDALAAEAKAAIDGLDRILAAADAA